MLTNRPDQGRLIVDTYYTGLEADTACHLAVGYCTIRQRVFDCKYLSCKICFNVLKYIMVLFILIVTVW